MTPTHKERLLADILAALLRIEALMQREKVAVTYPAPLTPWPTVPAADWPAQTVHAMCRNCIGKVCANSACPSRPKLTCGSPTVTLGDCPSTSMASTMLPPGTYVTPTATLPGMPDPPITPVRPQTTWSSLPTSCADKATGPSLNQGRFMHGGWIHATGFSMVGP